MVRHCCWGKCNSNTKYKDKDHMKGVFFITMPDPLVDSEKFKRWVHLCGRIDFNINTVSSSKVRWRQFICSKHFVGGNGPTEINPDPLPAHYTEEQMEKANKRGQSRKRKTGDLPDQSRSKATRISATHTDGSKHQMLDCDISEQEGETSLIQEPAGPQQDQSGVKTVSVYVQTDRCHSLEMTILRLRTELSIAEKELLNLKVQHELTKMKKVLSTQDVSTQHCEKDVADLPVVIAKVSDGDIETQPELNISATSLPVMTASNNDVGFSATHDENVNQYPTENQSVPNARNVSATSLPDMTASNSDVGFSATHGENVNQYPTENQSVLNAMIECPSSSRNVIVSGKQSCQTVKGTDCIFQFDKLSKNPDMFEYYTGLSLDSFNVVWAFVENESENMSYLHNDKKQGKTRKKRVYCKKDELLFTVIRLRRGRTLKEMAYETGVSETYMRRMFTTWVQLLYMKFSALRGVMFSTLSQVAKSTPASMKGWNVRCIIDCTEFACNQPKHFGKNGNRYSAYKGRTTFKVLVGIAPAGTITYISDAFEGSMSDVELVRTCDFLDFIEKGDVIMADRGFLIGDILGRKGAKLLIPPFLQGRKCFTPQEEAKTKFIAKNRIHVERAIERLKKFRILQRPISAQTENVLSQVIYISACLVNFQPPLAL